MSRPSARAMGSLRQLRRVRALDQVIPDRSVCVCETPARAHLLFLGHDSPPSILRPRFAVRAQSQADGLITASSETSARAGGGAVS